MSKTGIFWIDEITPKLMTMFKKYKKKVHPEAMAKVGLQLINWVVNGSSNESVIPPIKTGLLRGSGSVFVGKKFVGGVEGYPNDKQNKSYVGKENEIVIGFNTAYATRWHEEPFNPGEISLRSGNVGNKYLEKHLYSDAKDLLAFYAMLYKRGMNI